MKMPDDMRRKVTAPYKLYRYIGKNPTVPGLHTYIYKSSNPQASINYIENHVLVGKHEEIVFAREIILIKP